MADGASTETAALVEALSEARAAFDQLVRQHLAMRDVLADCVVKATEYGEQDGGFVAAYILPTGPLHRAIPLLAGENIHVRPGFDGRTGRLRGCPCGITGPSDPVLGSKPVDIEPDCPHHGTSASAPSTKEPTE